MWIRQEIKPPINHTPIEIKTENNVSILKVIKLPPNYDYRWNILAIKRRNNHDNKETKFYY